MNLLLREAALARRSGRPLDAECAYRRWMAEEPFNPAPRYGLSTLLLGREAWDEGWGLYEARKEVPQTGIRAPVLPMPEWRGEPVKSLLVWPEQGFGDQIMFSRFIPLLIGSGVEVTLATPPALARLFAAFECSVITSLREVRPHDAWCMIGSLPHRLGALPTAPYLPGSHGGSGVGVMVAGNPLHVNDADRGLPEAERDQLLSTGRDLSPEATGARDFEDTASIIRTLARVISVDTAVAHLAGAMGKPVEIRLGHDPDWRWGLGESSVWYPSARLVRRSTLPNE